MLKGVWGFIRREKGYVALFVFLSILYAGFWALYQSSPEKKERSPALQELEEAEKRWQAKVSDSEALKKYFRDHPVLSILFQVFSLLIVVAIGLGLFIDFIVLFKPGWRRNFFQRRAPPGPSVAWGMPMLFKAFVLAMAVSFLLGGVTGLLKQFLFPQLSLNVFALIHTTLLEIFCFMIVLYLVYRYQGTWRDLGFRIARKDFFKETAVGIAGYLGVLPIFFGVLIVLVIVAHALGYEPPPHPLVEVFLEEEKRAPGLVIYSIVLASLIGPVFEEIFFRGFCYPIFKSRWGVGWAMVLSAAFFALIHHNQFAFIPIFILGLGLAFLYEKRGNLVAPIALHVFHNSIFIGYFFLVKQILLQEGA